MIRDLSESLKAILMQPGLPHELACAQISYERPAEPFNPGTDTVDLFLYDVHENVDLRNNEPVTLRRNGTATVVAPPRRILCKYLVTAWTSGGTEPILREHRLLSQVLQTLARHPMIPPRFAAGQIKTSDPPATLEVAAGPPPAATSEFWSALGAKLRPSLVVQATLAMPVYPDESSELVRTQKWDFGERLPFPKEQLHESSRESTDATLLFGRVVRAADSAPVADARVIVAENGMSARTGFDGVFRVGPLPAGTYTLRVIAGTVSAEVQRIVPVPSGVDDVPIG